MKNVFANWKMPLTALLLVGGMMFVSSGAQAQASSTTTASVDFKGVTGAWVLEGDAMQLIQAELDGPIATALATLPEQSSQFIVWKYKGLLYEQTLISLQQGFSVSPAIRNNYDRLAGSSNAEPVISPLSQAEWQAILNELIDLLTT